MVNARHFKAFVAAAAFLTLPLIAEAVTYSGSAGTLSATVSFEVNGGDLVVTLTNTSPNDVLVPTDVLTAVFFGAAGNPLFTRTSATLDAGSTTIQTPGGSGSGTDSGGVVGGEWAYLNSLSVSGNNEGISATGLGLFGPGQVFPGSNLEGPASPDGLQYGIASAGDNVGTGNGGVQNNTLIKNSVVFHLGLNGNTFDPLTDITSVSFLYGTSLTDIIITGDCVDCPPPVTRVPEPGMLTLLGGSTLGLLGLSWRRRSRS
jgi:hypothetical protein